MTRGGGGGCSRQASELPTKRKSAQSDYDITVIWLEQQTLHQDVDVNDLITMYRCHPARVAERPVEEGFS